MDMIWLNAVFLELQNTSMKIHFRDFNNNEILYNKLENEKSTIPMSQKVELLDLCISAWEAFCRLEEQVTIFRRDIISIRNRLHFGFEKRNNKQWKTG